MPQRSEEEKTDRPQSREGRPRRVRETALKYGVAGSEPMPRTTISSKYQITLPARLVREIGLQPGDQLAVEVEHGALVLHPRPKDWVSYTAGSVEGLYGETKAEIDAYLREVRGDWGTYDDDDEEDEASGKS